MRLSYSLGSLLSIGQVLECADMLRKNNPDTVWVPETWGMECFSMLGAISQRVGSKIGSSVINVYSRSPALIGMGAVTVDTVSQGRLVLGLGTSSPAITENLHGVGFQRPLERMREYVEVIRKVTSGGRIDHSGEFFNLRGFSLLTRPFRDRIPIYMAAVNERMIGLASEIADGIIFYLRPVDELKKTAARMRAKNMDTTCQIITAMSHDGEKATARAKETIAFYVSVGKIYRDFLAQNGFKKETELIYDEFVKSKASDAGLVSDSMADALAIHGTPDECLAGLKKFTETGIDLPIIQFNPVGDTVESFRLMTSVFSGDRN